MDIFANWVLALGSIGTIIGAIYVIKTLRSNHDWKRREYALNIIRDWNANTSHHWQAIEEKYPHIRDVDRTGGKITELTMAQAREIYICEPSDDTNWALRYHLVEMLNYLEFIAMSYIHNVADHQILEACLKEALIKHYGMLKNVIEVVDICEGYRPWDPYTTLVGKWCAVTEPERKKTA